MRAHGRWDEQNQTVVDKWVYDVSKTKLAEVFWLTLKDKIDQCRVDAETPLLEIVEVVEDVYHLAQRWRYPSFALSEDPERLAAQ